MNVAEMRAEDADLSPLMGKKQNLHDFLKKNMENHDEDHSPRSPVQTQSKWHRSTDN